MLQILIHLLRIVNVLTQIVLNKPLPPFKESRQPGVVLEGPIGSVQGEAMYHVIYDRLKDTYRLSQFSKIIIMIISIIYLRIFENKHFIH